MMRRAAPTDMWRRFARCVAGASALEFALIAPVVVLILTGMIDYGLAVYTRFSMNERLSAAANYAMLSAASVGSSSGATLAATLVAIIPSQFDVTVVVNNGPAAQRVGGVSTPSGTASNADLCYCPTLSGSTVAWGSATTCASTCSSGVLAGKFVTIACSRSYTPLLMGYGLVSSGVVSDLAVVQVQ
ncbi:MULTISPECIES: TadE/TadG family type IV pilus assembly protein [Methylosinus]|nr:MULTISPECIES: TadE/TadG family type IV pilus assembly protein [Methylosinus]OBS54426.1 hypothetical protein A8B73_00705 [Methylosinus sp. 3S-1]